MEFVTHLKIHVTKQIYYTNDCTGDNYANYWSTKLNYSSTELFENPSGGNFRVQIPEYAIYGDPRWNK